jgi:ribosome biogenesis protein UTP30
VVRPIRIAIPNSIFNAGGEGHNICLFVRSEDKVAIESELSNSPIEGVDKVLSINDVKKLYAPHKEKKTLLNTFTHFVCDVRIMGHLYNLLGKVFGARNHYPIPIEYKNPSKLDKAMALFKDATYMHYRGSNITIRFGHTKQTADEINKNIEVGLAFAVQKLPNQWKDVVSIHIKSSDSAALPVFSKLPGNEEFKFVQKQLTKSDSAEEIKSVESVSKKPEASKKAAAKKAEPKKAEPKKAEPKKAEPKKAEPKKVAAKSDSVGIGKKASKGKSNSR